MPLHRSTPEIVAAAKAIEEELAPLRDKYGQIDAWRVRERLPHLIIREDCGHRGDGVTVYELDLSRDSAGYGTRDNYHSFGIMAEGSWAPGRQAFKVSSVELDAALAAHREHMAATKRERNREAGRRFRERQKLSAAKEKQQREEFVARGWDRISSQPVGEFSVRGIACVQISFGFASNVAATKEMMTRWLAADPTAAEAFGEAWRACTGYCGPTPSDLLCDAKRAYCRAAIAAARRNGWRFGCDEVASVKGRPLVFVVGPNEAQMSWHISLAELGETELPRERLEWDGIRGATYRRFAALCS